MHAPSHLNFSFLYLHTLWLLCEFLINTDHTYSLLKLSSFHFILHAVLWSLASKPTIPELKAVGHPL